MKNGEVSVPVSVDCTDTPQCRAEYGIDYSCMNKGGECCSLGLCFKLSELGIGLNDCTRDDQCHKVFDVKFSCNDVPPDYGKCCTYG